MCFGGLKKRKNEKRGEKTEVMLTINIQPLPFIPSYDAISRLLHTSVNECESNAGGCMALSTTTFTSRWNKSIEKNEISKTKSMKKLPKNILVTKSSSGNLNSVYVILVSLLLDKDI